MTPRHDKPLNQCCPNCVLWHSNWKINDLYREIWLADLICLEKGEVENFFEHPKKNHWQWLELKVNSYNYNSVDNVASN